MILLLFRVIITGTKQVRSLFTVQFSSSLENCGFLKILSPAKSGSLHPTLSDENSDDFSEIDGVGGSGPRSNQIIHFLQPEKWNN